MRALLLCGLMLLLALAVGCGKPSEATKGSEAKPPEPDRGASERAAAERIAAAERAANERIAAAERDFETRLAEAKKKEPVALPKKSQYDVATAGDIELDQPANLWDLPEQNRAVLKERFFGKRWNIKPSGNITIETDRVLAETHPHTEWLTVTAKFRNNKDLLIFDRYKSKINGYCVDAFTFVDCVYIK